MGKLHYNSSSEHDFEDRLLAHLQLVIGTKLGKGESFCLSWKNAVDVRSGRRSVWLHHSILFEFAFASSRPPSINTAWVRQLLQDSYTVNGLRISRNPTRAEPTLTRPTPRLHRYLRHSARLYRSAQ
ncbi:ATP-dependent DNA ligase [Rathayibacter sp. AY1B8]|uniref:DUF7882 family protein n=1 Tax=Rathayibacter sp. AY1B8 TaxID=2080533 RepID=UPI0015E446E6|nr:ATP-dependent DNA ligase [Rathayibacter sp. AY1B8]